jgi:hypothetical protein
VSTISRLIIDQQFAEIGVKITPAQMQITTPHPEMQITREDAQMTVESQMPQFKINRQRINSESGLMNPLDLNRQIAGSSQDTALKGTAKTAEDGNFAVKTQEQGNRIAQIARRRSRQSSQKDLNIGLMPKSSPEIEWDPGHVKINWSGHEIRIDWVGEYMPETVIDPPYSIEVYLRTQPYFRITVEAGADPFQVGQRVDEVL